MLRHDGAPRVHHLNTVRLRSCPSPAGLEALAERWLTDRPTRQVVIEDPSGERIAGALAAHGWERSRVVLMTLAPAAALAPAHGAAVRVVDEATLDPLEREILREQSGRPGDPELLEQMLVAQRALRAGTRSVRFVAEDDGRPASMATLLLDPDVAGARLAQIELVATLQAHRGRGLATAAVRAASDAARTWGAELVTVVTDADDWPQVWYANLGFAAVTRHVGYTRPRSDRSTA